MEGYEKIAGSFKRGDESSDLGRVSSPTLDNAEHIDDVSKIVNFNSNNHKLKSPGNIFSKNSCTIARLDDSSEISGPEIQNYENIVSKNMAKLRFKQLEKKTIGHISNRRVSYTRS